MFWPPRWRMRNFCFWRANERPALLAPPASAVRTHLTVAAYRQKIWDLEDKSSSTYDKLKDEDEVWDSECPH